VRTATTGAAVGTVDPMSEEGEAAGEVNGAAEPTSRAPRVLKEQSQALQGHLEALGTFIRNQRKLADLSLRDLAERTNVSNPYLSQIERGLHEPSVRVLRSIARALNVSAETLLAQAGVLEGDETGPSDRPPATTEDAIRADPNLSHSQKEALLSVYRSYRAAAQ
jgi:transcriptional regulator with XRE-family HTH domain